MSKKKDKIRISVAVITYNQQETIGQTLDSILMQKGDFDLEVVIGEDCSPDNTLAICQDYVRQVESGKWKVEGCERTIKLLSGQKNLGITANYFRVLQACIGEFIGDIAGDDYYCDDHALEKQMKYLQAHPEVGVLGANGYRYYVKRNEKVLGENERVNTMDAKEFYFSPNYPGGVIIQGGGAMFRRLLLQYIDFDEIIRRKLPVEDYPMQAIWSQHTKFWRLDDPIVVYRVYKESATFVPFEHPKYLNYYKGLADTRRYLNELFPNDVCFSEEWLKEYEFYKEFLLYLHRFEFKNAKQLIASVSSTIPNSTKLKQAKRFSKTRLHFVAAHYIKEYNYRKDLNNRV
jgi:glycosyltransferase involved in cell wall biosynthesis